MHSHESVFTRVQFRVQFTYSVIPQKRMPKRFWSERSGSAAKWQKPLFRRNVRARGASTFQRRGRRAMASGRFAGYYRKTGWYRKPNSGPELKFFDGTMTDAVVASGGVVVLNCMNIIDQGVSEQQRIGRKIVLRSIAFRYFMTLPEQDAASTPPPNDVLRILIIQDKQCNGTAATVNGDGGPLFTNDTNTFNNLNNKSRFVTLMDRTHMLNYQTLASDGAGLVSSASLQENYSWFKKLNIPLEFSGTTGAITELRSNNLFCVIMGTASHAGFDSRFRLRFSDEG